MKGSKAQRQNQHMKKLMLKIKKFEKQGKSVDKLKKELSFAVGEKDRPAFKTGKEADPKFKYKDKNKV
tara:strand:+ start:35377 stop:35580 length:204 start_codon:yes stop_codon:yes gene_type:complete